MASEDVLTELEMCYTELAAISIKWMQAAEAADYIGRATQMRDWESDSQVLRIRVQELLQQLTVEELEI